MPHRLTTGKCHVAFTLVDSGVSINIHRESEKIASCCAVSSEFCCFYPRGTVPLEYVGRA